MSSLYGHTLFGSGHARLISEHHASWDDPEQATQLDSSTEVDAISMDCVRRQTSVL